MEAKITFIYRTAKLNTRDERAKAQLMENSELRQWLKRVLEVPMHQADAIIFKSQQGRSSFTTNKYHLTVTERQLARFCSMRCIEGYMRFFKSPVITEYLEEKVIVEPTLDITGA